MVAGEKKDEVKKTFDVQRIITKWDGGTSKSFTLTKGTKLNLGEGFALSTTIGATLNNHKPIVLWKMVPMSYGILKTAHSLTMVWT